MKSSSLFYIVGLFLISSAEAGGRHLDPLFPSAPIFFNGDGGPSDLPNFWSGGSGDVPSCFAPGTVIELAVHGASAIENIAVGTMVDSAAPNEMFSKANPSILQGIVSGISSVAADHALAVLTLQNGIVLKGTSNHPIATDHGFVQLAQLTPSDVVITKNGLVGVKSVLFEPYSGQVYNLIVSKSSNGQDLSQGTFFANGILVGDLNVQKSMH